MKENSILRIKEIIYQSKNIKSCLNSLNLSVNSAFICLLNLIEDAIINYNPINDYEYLDKVTTYLKILYEDLHKNKKILYRSQILKLKKIAKTSTSLVDNYDKIYFKKIYLTLDELINSSKENKNKENKKNQEIKLDGSLYELVYKAIFTFESLDYLDLLIEKSPDILNVKLNNEPIFIKILEVYLESVKNKNNKSNYYIRVINKFFHEKTFDLENQMQDIILKTLNDFLNGTSNLNKKDLFEIKNLISYIKKQYVLNTYNIRNSEYELSNQDLEYLERNDPNLSDRVRLNDYIITIDDEDSKVLDDGISIRKLKNGNILFKIHIADPLGIFPYQSNIIQDAKDRTTTIYAGKQVIQMFPSTLATDKLSLVEGQERFAKTFYFEYSKDYGIVYFKIINSIVKVTERLSYDKINELYKKGGTSEFDAELLNIFDEILCYLKKVFKNAKVYEEIKRENIIGHNQKISGFAESLISYLMMFTGYKTAEYFSQNNLPYVYRCHFFDSKWQEFLNSYINDPNKEEYKKMLKEIKERFPKSYYTRDNVGHMGLKVPYYSHITSPLRRFADDLNFYAIDTCYFDKPNDKKIYRLEKEIDLTCDYFNMQSNSIDEYFNKIKAK